MKLIRVDQEKCVRCGACSEVCPVRIIGMKDQGPQYIGGRCIACGHCVAVCPTAALDNHKAPLAKQTELETTPVLPVDAAARFLRGRRSIRCYKQTAVAHESILQLLDVARMAPTGGNSQGVSYYVFEKTDMLRAISAAVIDWMEEAIKAASPWAPYFCGTVAGYRAGTDTILRGAPCLIVAVADKAALQRGRDNTHFSLAYAELFAPSIGLGTCWAGFFEACASAAYQPLLALLDLPDHLAVTGALMAGYPQYTYKRLVDRNPLQVTWK